MAYITPLAIGQVGDIALAFRDPFPLQYIRPNIALCFTRKVVNRKP